MSSKSIIITDEGLKKMTETLDYLRNVKRKEVIEAISKARSFGDLSENSEYDEAKNEQGKVFSRIAELEYILSHASVIDDKDVNADRIGIGSHVAVMDMATGEREEYTIVGSQEANPMIGRISEESPFGRALVGKKAGDELNVEVPSGKLHYKVLDIQR